LRGLPYRRSALISFLAKIAAVKFLACSLFDAVAEFVEMFVRGMEISDVRRIKISQCFVANEYPHGLIFVGSHPEAYRAPKLKNIPLRSITSRTKFSERTKTALPIYLGGSGAPSHPRKHCGPPRRHLGSVDLDSH